MDLNTLDAVHRAVIFAAFYHAVDRENVDLPETTLAVAEELTKQTNLRVNEQPCTGWAATAPIEEVQCVWASLQGSINDIHAPLDHLSDASWKLIDETFAILNLDEDPQFKAALGHSPDITI
jgi:hypothetical protein